MLLRDSIPSFHGGVGEARCKKLKEKLVAPMLIIRILFPNVDFVKEVPQPEKKRKRQAKRKAESRGKQKKKRSRSEKEG